jgi:hypothetical protein
MMAFNITPNVHIEHDSDGVVRFLRHLQVPYTLKDAGFTTAAIVTSKSLAIQYIRDVASIYKIDPVQLIKLDKKPEKKLIDTLSVQIQDL